MACAPSEDSDQPGHPPSLNSDQPGHPPSLIRVFALRMKKAWVLSDLLSAQWRLWSDWADAQADMSLRWAHMTFCWFCHEAAQLNCVWQVRIYEPEHDKTNKIACAPSEDSDQPGYPPSLISLCFFCDFWVAKDPNLQVTAKTLTRLSGCPG